MTELNLQQWVTQAPTSKERTWHQAVHTVITAISRNAVLRDAMTLKGGILLALGYGSSRYTTDLDFSNPETYSSEISERVLSNLTHEFPLVVEELGYDVDCRVQSHKVNPKSPKATFQNVQIKIAHAPKGTRQHRRLLRGESTFVLNIDYNFSESITGRVAWKVDGDASLYTYSLPTLMAEKYRAILQQPLRNRVRRQDVYDLHYAITHYSPFSKADKERVLKILKQKCRDRLVPLSQSALENPEVRAHSEREYDQLQDEIKGALPNFDHAYQLVQSFFEQLPWDSTDTP